ncbi:MAG: spermidine synthase, partial [Nannocystaceae bacterium]
MEIVWYRMFAPLLGGSAYSFGLILTMALLGIGSGAAFYGVYGRLRRPILATFSITCAVEALLIAVPFGVGDDLAALTLVSRGLEVFGFAGLVMSWVVITAFVVFPPAFVAGFQFPLLVGLLGEGREAIARQVGAAYFANTVGSILGALGSGFGLLVLVGALRLWSAMVIVLLAVAALALALAWRRAPRERWSGGVVAVSVAVSGICLYAEGPTSAWRHAPIGAGRVEDAAIQSANNFEAFRRRFQTNVTWEADGRESSVGLRSLHGVSFSVSGKTDGHTVGDFDTVVMCPLIAAAFHPEPRRGLVIGLGTGTSAGWLAEVPTMAQVDVVEFEPAILEVARVAAPVNHDVLDHPKVQVIIGDGREVLMTSTTTYDVIMSEPSNPYRAGIASLYSQDFYEAASLTMSEDGIFVQWLQGYEIDARTFESAVATLRSVFPAVEVWMTDYAGDIALVAFKSEAPLDTAIMEARLSEPPYREALAKSWGVAGVPGLLSGFTIGRDATTTILEQNRDFIDTDD